VTDYEIRQVSGEEMLDVLHPLMNYAFSSSPPFPDRDSWSERAGHRQGITCFAAFDGATPAACAQSTAMVQNVRGALLGMGAVWGVTTHPSARRRGLCRKLLTRLLAAMHDAGEAVSGLYPFRESFYERLGWVTFPQLRKATFSPLALAPLLGQEVDGQVELALIGDALDDYRVVVEQVQRSTHGMALVRDVSPATSFRDRAWVAVARAAGAPVGALVYTLKGEHVADFTLHAQRFCTVSSQARYLLLQWIAHHIDQASSVEVTLAPHELPETWFSDLKPVVETTHVGPMGRVVDVAGLSGMEVGAGSVTVHVRDALCPWNEGVWRFEGQGGRLVVTSLPQTSTVDGEVAIQAVSAMVYGTHDPADFPFRGWAPASAGLQSSIASLFPRKLPHMHEMF
jgi:predicted acetyltransferase